MDKIELSEKNLAKISSSSERLIGYVYSGFTPFLILAIEKHDIVQNFVSAVGGAITALICLALGIGVYTIYFKVIGELFIFPLQHILHIGFDWLCLRDFSRSSSPIAVIHSYGVPWFQTRAAYQSLKDEFFTGAERNELHLSHGEISVLYITALIASVSYIVLSNYGIRPSPLYLIFSSITFLAALVADTRQHIKEGLIIRRRREPIVCFLREKGFAHEQSALHASS